MAKVTRLFMKAFFTSSLADLLETVWGVSWVLFFILLVKGGLRNLVATPDIWDKLGERELNG